MIVSLMTACTTAGISVIDSSCTSFGLIYPSRKDTTETKRQVLNHNQVYERICKKEK